MKKKLLLLLLGMILFSSRVYAIGINLKSSANSITKGSSATVSVTISSSNPLFFVEGTLRCSGAGVNGGISLNFDNMDNNVLSKSYSYKITPSSAGTVTCQTTGVRLTDSSSDAWQNISDKSIKITVNNPASITPKTYSSNNYLSSLSVEGYEIEFNRDKLEYAIDLPNDVKKIKINAKLEDNKASLSGVGEFDVIEGENVFSIKVVAENGNERVYKIKANVLELDPINVKINGEEYTIVRKSGVLEIPSKTYEETTIDIDGNNVLAYHSDITKFTLVILKNKDGNSNYYIYKNGKYILYKEYNFNNTYLYILDKEIKDNNYKKVSFKYDEDNIDAYKLSPHESLLIKNTYASDYKSSYYLFYAINTLTGKEELYQYDSVENTIQKYNIDEINYYKKEANTYKLYLYITLGILAFTILLLIVILIVKTIKRNKKRNTPVME